jgi:polysaccharide export outer membrane protein
VVQPGDVLEIMILEAPPAVLFGSAALGFGAVGASSATTLPQYMVQQSGVISVPFAGIIQATGRTLPEIERTIVSRLQGKAHLPQVMVRLVQNHSANVTVVGEVATSVRMPLTPKGEQLLDALAAAGGAKQSVEKMTIQITRDGMVQSMPLSAIIADPRQNIVLKSNDVVTALYQPYSFTVLGAVGKNDELHFEATGITLSQAMGRVSGLMDGRADPKGVFLFRWEYPAALPAHSADVVPDVNGRIPVIYRVNMKDPATYLAMQHFQIRDKDVMYVSINPITEFQRVFSLISSSFLPALTAERTLNRN